MLLSKEELNHSPQSKYQLIVEQVKYQGEGAFYKF